MRWHWWGGEGCHREPHEEDWVLGLGVLGVGSVRTVDPVVTWMLFRYGSSCASKRMATWS